MFLIQSTTREKDGGRLIRFFRLFGQLRQRGKSPRVARRHRETQPNSTNKRKRLKFRNVQVNEKVQVSTEMKLGTRPIIEWFPFFKNLKSAASHFPVVCCSEWNRLLFHTLRWGGRVEREKQMGKKNVTGADKAGDNKMECLGKKIANFLPGCVTRRLTFSI